jgi:small-conductance mechanosensitive channel
MDCVFLLAQGQETGSGRPLVNIADRLFEKYPPEIAIPVFIVIVVVVAVVLERLLVFIARRVTAKTRTTVDDAFAAGMPSVLRPLMAMVALQIVTNVWFRVEKEEKPGVTVTELTQVGRWVSLALTVVSVVVLALCVTRLLLKMVDAWVADAPTRKTVGPTIKFLIKVGAVPIALLLAAEAAGVSVGSILAAASVPALAVGLALQDTLKNMFAGVQIVIDQPIRAGDFVEVDRNTRGTVLEIGLRSTKIRSVDNNTIIIPNAIIAGAIVTNLDYQDRSFIQALDVSVAYGNDSRRVQAILEDELARAARELDGVTVEPNAVALKQLGASALDFAMSVRLRQWAGRMPIVTELYHRIYARLAAERIEIPYPTQTIHLRQDSGASAASAPSPR